MSREVNEAAKKWLRENDWDYQKYGDRRGDRSAYDTLMNYEVSYHLEDAFLAGAAWQREQDAKNIESLASIGSAWHVKDVAAKLRESSSDDPARCSCPQAQPRADMPFCMLCKRMLRAPTQDECAHEWGTDGMHSNVFCKKCFKSQQVPDASTLHEKKVSKDG